MVNPNLPKWILGSIANYMKEVADSLEIECFVEGLDQFDPDSSNSDRVEVRVHGPDIKQLSSNVYRIRVSINLLLTSFMSSTKNAYNIYLWCGEFSDAMTTLIPIYEIGDGNELVGCLTYKRTRDTELKVFHFPRVTKEDFVRQTELDCNYEMEIY